MSPNFDAALSLINQLAADLGIFSGRQKSEFLYYDPPKDWSGTVYYFAYTPWKTVDPETGKTGFFALKYRFLKTTENWKLVKKTRFGRRKIASARALKWHGDYYRGRTSDESGDKNE